MWRYQHSSPQEDEAADVVQTSDAMKKKHVFLNSDLFWELIIT